MNSFNHNFFVPFYIHVSNNVHSKNDVYNKSLAMNFNSVLLIPIHQTFLQFSPVKRHHEWDIVEFRINPKKQFRLKRKTDSEPR